MTEAGFPHSEIFGSKRACRSPKLIAACCVLRRLMTPRHSPMAVTGFMQTLNYLGVYFTHLQKNFLTLNFQRTKVFTLGKRVLSGHRPHSPAPRLRRASFATQQDGCATRGSQGARMVGPDGFEPSTPRLSSACSNQLSYEPRMGTAVSKEEVANMVEPDGFEPTTSCLQSRRSAN